ncbi:MAG TPA: ABC transporter permease [Polyangiaceae bacterium]|nr:ABC transporter permease [Polyangiaceae bacterium]
MIRLVLLKELVDHWRDLRSVAGSLVLVVLGPLLLFGMFQIVQNLEKERPLEVPVVGAEQAPHLIQHLVANGVHVLPPPADPEARVRKGDADMVLVIDDHYAERYKASQLAHVRLIVDDSRNESHKNVRRVERILLGYTQGLGALRLMARGVSPQVAAPLALEELDLATPQKLAANLLSMVPLFLMLAALVGGMNLAIDSTAGERERGSLEPLLLNPVSRRSLVVGKWLATALASTVVALLTLVGMMLTIQQLPLERLGMKIALGPREAGLIVAALLPLTLFGAAVQMLIATFARSFKEAQTYLGLLNLVPMVPSMFLMMGSTQNEWWMYPLPTLAQVTVVVSVLRGDLVPGWQLLVIALSSLLYSALCVAAIERLLRRERIIFGR